MRTNVPPQRLFLMNSPFVEEQAKALAARVDRAMTRARIRRGLSDCVRARSRSTQELKLGTGFLREGDWNQYARVLLNSNEFLLVN